MYTFSLALSPKNENREQRNNASNRFSQQTNDRSELLQLLFDLVDLLPHSLAQNVLDISRTHRSH